MLYHPDFNDVSIDTYRLEIFPTFMLSDGVYITCSLNWENLEVIANIQC